MAPAPRRGNARRTTAAKPTTRTRRAPVEPVKAARDVTQYADKEPTPYHKAFAKWIVTEVGYRPSAAASAKEAFLMGVSIATAARPAFTESEFLAEWRERTGEPKPGRKPGGSAAAEPAKPTRKGRKPAPEPEPEEDDDDFDDADEDGEEDDEFDDDDDSGDDDSDEDVDDEEDDAPDDEDDDEDFEDEPEPVKPARKATRKPTAPAKRAPAGKAAPAKRGRPAKATSKPASDDYVF